MRHAATKNTGNAYVELVDSCKHSRLKAALSSHLPQAPARVQLAAPMPAPAAAEEEVLPYVMSEATGSYLWVAGMSVVSLLSVVVTSAITA